MQLQFSAVCLVESIFLSLRKPLVFQIDLVRLAVVEDMLFEDINLLDPGILFADRRQQ